MPPGAPDYTTVTEVPGTGITRQALDMLWTRYSFAADLCAGRDVLEVACGSGQGLARLAARARRVVGSDFTYALARAARREYGGAIPVVHADAQALPFAAGSFDAVVMFEAVYYLPDPQQFVRECRRLLRPGGLAVLCSVNPQWSDFNPSPQSHHYLNASQMQAAFAAEGFEVRLAGGFPAHVATPVERAVSVLKRSAVSLGLMPTTMKGKRLLKRLFLDKVVNAPARLDEGMATYHQPAPFDVSNPGQYKVFYTVARLR